MQQKRENLHRGSNAHDHTSILFSVVCNLMALEINLLLLLEMVSVHPRQGHIFMFTLHVMDQAKKIHFSVYKMCLFLDRSVSS